MFTKHGIIYNPRHHQGYLSIDDEPITTSIVEGEDERAGRWWSAHTTEWGIDV